MGDSGIGGFFKAHPVILLLILTPGIPEYLSGSSAIDAIVFNPPFFLLQLAANLGLYGSGVLLIREAKVRWNKGWASVLLLGGAYGILEEGVALSTLYDPTAGPAGPLGVYGHWLGVNWVWAAYIVPWHAIFSVSLPLVVLGLFLPETSGRSFLKGRRLAATVAILVIDVVFLMAFVARAAGYWMGWPILVGSLTSIGVLAWAGRRVSAGALTFGSGAKKVSDRTLAAFGLSFFPAVFLSREVPRGAGVPPAATVVLVLLVQASYAAYLTRRSWQNRARGTIALGLGLLMPIMAFGVIAELALPLTILADLAVIVFFRRLWAKYPHPDPLF